jgi:glycosyltransferase involved in cell wall biosynthesis
VVGYRDWIHAEDVGLNGGDLHIATELTKQPQVRKVLFVNRPVSIAEQSVRKKRWKCRKGELVDSGFGYRLFKIPEYQNFYVLNLWVADIISPLIKKRLWWDLVFLRQSIINRIAYIKKKLEIRDDVLYLFTPFAVSTLKNIPHNILAFDVIDNITKHVQYSNQEKQFCKQAYKTISQRANVITCVSSEIKDLFRESSAYTLVRRNGVDREWLEMNPEKPEEFSQIKGKIVGFGGHFSEKFNSPFLVDLAQKMPDITFVLLGKIYNKAILKPFDNINNIRYLGFRTFAELPSYYYHFDAAFILYRPEKENDGDPLKLYEYLSLGTPVVSLPSKGVDRFPDVVMVRNTVKSFEKALRDILDSDRLYWRERCRAALSEEDFWDRKAFNIVSLLSRVHKGK